MQEKIREGISRGRKSDLCDDDTGAMPGYTAVKSGAREYFGGRGHN